MKDLAQRLRSMATSLDKNAAQFEGKHWSRAVHSFSQALARFEAAVQDAQQGLAPGLNDLLKLFESPMKKVLDEHTMKKLFKEVLDHKAPHDQSPAKLRSLFLAEIKNGKGNAKKALVTAQEIIKEAQTPKEKPPRDADKLKLEFYRLGGLDQEQLDHELAERYKDKADLKRLAEAVGVPLPEDAKKHQISKAIAALAKRVHGHMMAG